LLIRSQIVYLFMGGAVELITRPYY